MGRGNGWTAHPPLASAAESAASRAAPAALRLEVADAGRLWRRAVRGVIGAARAKEQMGLADLLSQHLRGSADELGEMDVVEEQWAAYEHVNVQNALDSWVSEPQRSHNLVGIIGYQHRPFGLAELLDRGSGHSDPFGTRPGRASRVNRASGPDGAVMACLMCALYLVSEGDDRAALLLRGPDPQSGKDDVSLHVVAADAGFTDRVIGELRRRTIDGNVFRGQVLSFSADIFGRGQALMTFHRRQRLEPEQLILPNDVLELVERQVVGVARHAERLRQAGQHLKRGVLLYGPPGVGKTHTVRYLVGRLEGTTVILLSGDSLHLVAEACSVARSLQPAMIVVEDVDLIAEERGHHAGQNPMLFQLLNEMDGLGEDVDVVFLLTTNRADLLEPALAARPGRVDQAIELALPDPQARRRLFELYTDGLDIDTSGIEEVLQRTEGVTASFLKELIRRSALLAAERDDSSPLRVAADDVTTALEELLDTRNAMTRAVLGGSA